jgi:putative DNA-invertase from lambdoid prophage Rac
LAELGIGFVSLTEAFDMTTPTGRALAGMLAVFADNAERGIMQGHSAEVALWLAYQTARTPQFAEFEREIPRERGKAGIAQARAKGTTFGRPKSTAKKTAEVRRLYRKEKLTKSEIARRLGIGRTSVRRLLEGT